jgi:hypothetical protein
MRCANWMIVLAFLATCALGCGKTDGTGGPTTGTTGNQTANNQQTQLEAPAQSVAQFLEACRTGNDVEATQMLSTIARTKVKEMKEKSSLSVTPPASDTARFEVGKVEYVGEDGAQVACNWTDLDENGKEETNHAVWVVRREAEGWRVAGVAATVFEGEPPLLLNFEDPEDMAKKQAWLEAEALKRSNPANQGTDQAKSPEKPEESIRR